MCWDSTGRAGTEGWLIAASEFGVDLFPTRTCWVCKLYSELARGRVCKLLSELACGKVCKLLSELACGKVCQTD